MAATKFYAGDGGGWHSHEESVRDVRAMGAGVTGTRSEGVKNSWTIHETRARRIRLGEFLEEACIASILRRRGENEVFEEERGGGRG